MKRYEEISHTADVAVIAHGSTLHEAFESAAFAMFDIVFDLEGATGSERRQIRADGDSHEELLVSWLSEILSESETSDLAFSRFGIELVDTDAGVVKGWAAGDPAGRFELNGAPIKAITYHDLEISEDGDGWSIRVVFDV